MQDKNIEQSILRERMKSCWICQGILQNWKKGQIIEMNNSDIQEKIRLVKSRIEKLIEEGRLDEAKYAIEKYESKSAGDADICSMSAIISIIEGALDKAESKLHEGLKKDSVHFDLLYNLAYLYEQRGQLQQAADLYCKAGTAAKDQAQQDNVTDAVERLKGLDDSIQIHEKDRIVFFVKEGMDSFLGDIIRDLSDKYWTRKMIISDFKHINDGMEWADICWFEWCDELVIYGSRLPLAKQKKIVCRLHRYEVFTDNPSKVVWENVDKLVIVTRHLQDVLEINNPGISNKVEIVVVENGVDVDRFAFKERSKGFNLAMVGYIHSRKNPVLLLQIIKKLVDMDKRYKLYIAGAFQEQMVRMYWDYQVRRMGLERNVIFEGWQDDINSWLEDKSYLLSTSIHESFGYGIAEAMARGIKPVIYDFLYANEIWDEKFLFSTVDEAAEAILTKEYTSCKYRSFIEEKYSLLKQISQVHALMDELLSFKKIIRRVKDILEGKEQPAELMHKSLTVLIPNYNRARMLKEDVDNGLKLASQDKLVVDDCSTEEKDWLEEITKSDNRAKVIRKESNSGVAESRRTGLEAIETEYTTFVDDDNIMLCLDKEMCYKDISELRGGVSIVVPRYIVNYYGNKLTLGYDRHYYHCKTGAQVVKDLAQSGEMMGLLTGGAIGDTRWMSKHASCPMFRVSEDFVMLARMMADRSDMKIKATEGMVFVRRFLDEGSTLNQNPTKLALGLISQAVACYYCLRLRIADKDEILGWMRERASLIQKIYDFGESFETELIAYLTGEINEEVFVHFLRLHGIKIENDLDELAPELKKMRRIFYKESSIKHKITYEVKLPLVSIIIPTYNRKDMLKRAIDNALKQDYPNLEVIVSDNCSDDGTYEMVTNSFMGEKRLVYNRNEKNIGPTLNYYKAFYEIAKGEYCMTQSDDDYFIDSSYISKAVKMLNENKELSFVFACNYYYHEGKNKIYRVKPDYVPIINGDDFFINFLMTKFPYMPNLCTTLFRRDLACEIQILNCDPNCLSADLSILLRLLLKGDAGFINDIVLTYTLHRDSISLNSGTCVTETDDSYDNRALRTARADIDEVRKIGKIAQDYRGFSQKEINEWFIFRVYKYMYWRLNETTKTKQESILLLKYIAQEYPALLDTLKNVAQNRFGEIILEARC